MPLPFLREKARWEHFDPTQFGTMLRAMEPIFTPVNSMCLAKPDAAIEFVTLFTMNPMRCLSFLFAINLSMMADASRLKLVKIPSEMEQTISEVGAHFIHDHFSHPSVRVGYLEDAELGAMNESLRKRIEILDERAWAMGGYDPKSFARKSINERAHYEGYHDYASLSAELKRLSHAFPHLVHLQTAGKSVQGRELWYAIVSDNAAVDEPEPKFLFHANMHGDEVVGRELMIYFLRHVLEQYGRDPRITQLVNHSQLFIMPSMNPDGFELRTRANANGKDLNRNFPDRFSSSSDTPAGREIEVQHMMRLAAQHHFVYGINWHGGEICFNLPWGNISNASPEKRFGDDHFFNPIGREYSDTNTSMHANDHDNFDHGLTYGYEWYPVNGGINDWFNFFRRSVHSVIELTSVKWPQASTLAKHWDDNREAMVTYLWRGLRGVHLEVRDQAGIIVNSPTIAIALSPRRPLTFDNGFVHRLTGDGEQGVTISAPGYLTKSVTVTASYFNGVTTPVTLLSR